MRVPALLATTLLASACLPAAALATQGVRIVGSSEPFIPDYSADNVIANGSDLSITTGTDYSSRGAGTNTYIDFQLGKPYRVNSVTYIDRLHNQGELTNPPDEKLQVWWTRSDLNGDRKIQQSEMVWDSTHFFDQMDADRNGSWSAEEARAANAEAVRLLSEEGSRPDYLLLQSRPRAGGLPGGDGGGGGPGGLGDIAAQYDKNKDGTVTRDEAVLDGEQRYAQVNQNGDDHVSAIEALHFGRVETQVGLWANDDNLKIGDTSDFTTSFRLTFSQDATFGNDDDVVFDSGAIAVPNSPTGISDFLTIVDTGGTTARYLRWNVTAATGLNPGAYAFSFDTSAVPEPTSWAMMLFGFAAVGSVARRNVRTAPTPA